MFGLDLWCDYREDFQMIAEAVVDETLEGDEAKDGEENE